MTRFTVERDVRAPATVVWAALVHWPDHGRWAPLTRVEVLTPTGEGVGARFTGRTGVGPLAFDDLMEVVTWTPPSGDGDGDAAGRCEVVKQGRVVLGRAWFTVTPRTLGGRPGCRVVWDEDVEVAPVLLTRPFGPLLAAGGRAGFARMLALMAREVEARAGEAA